MDERMTEKRFTWNRIAIEKAKILSKLRYSGSEVGAVIGTSRMSCLSRANRKQEFTFTGRLRGGTYSEERFLARVAEAETLTAHVTDEWIAAQDALRAAEALANPVPPPQPEAPKPAKPRLLGLPDTVTPLARYEKEFINLNRVRFLEKPAAPIVRGEGGISLWELTSRSCRWILGDADGFDTCYCGKKNRGMHKGGSSYCEEHEKLSKQQPRKKKRDPQNTELEDAIEEKTIFLPKKSSSGLSSLNYSRESERSKI
jgi:hypothetical protein